MDTLNIHIQHLLFEIQRKAKIMDHIADLEESIDIQEENLDKLERSLKAFNAKLTELKAGYNLPFWGNKNKDELELVDQQIKDLSLSIAKLIRLIDSNKYEKQLLENSLKNTQDYEFELNQLIEQKEEQLIEENTILKIRFNQFNQKIEKLERIPKQLSSLITLHPKIKYNQNELDRLVNELCSKDLFVFQNQDDSYFSRLYYGKIITKFKSDFIPRFNNFLLLLEEYNSRALQAKQITLKFEADIYEDFLNMVDHYPPSEYKFRKFRNASALFSQSFLKRLSKEISVLEREISEARAARLEIMKEKKKEIIHAVTKKPDTK